MKALKITLLIFIILIAVVFLLGWYMGFYKEVKLEDKEAGGHKVIGVEFIGPYAKVGKSMVEVDEKLKIMDVNCEKGFGIYYDDPKTVPAEKCRSFIGNILKEEHYSKISELRSAGFKTDSIPYAKAVVAEFPIKNSLSYMLAPIKVYPVISEYLKAKGYTSSLTVEIYDIPNKKILFMVQYNPAN